MIGLSNRFIRSGVRIVSGQRNMVVGAAAAIVLASLAAMRFGVVFNYTHSAPFGLYREISRPSDARHDPAPYVFFCPDVRWPAMKGQPNYRNPMRTCPDGFAPLIKPVVAWPGDTVETSAAGISVNGHFCRTRQRWIGIPTVGRFIPFRRGSIWFRRIQLWVVSSFSPRSFDSRYFGPIPLKSVRSWIRPLFVERHYPTSANPN